MWGRGEKSDAELKGLGKGMEERGGGLPTGFEAASRGEWEAHGGGAAAVGVDDLRDEWLDTAANLSSKFS
jgi:hypothetical protein